MKKISEECPFPFNPDRDIQPVDQYGFVDLREAFVNGSIPGNLNVDQESYNGVEDPSSLLGKSSDVFDALRKAKYVKDQESAASRAAATAEAGAASSSANE